MKVDSKEQRKEPKGWVLRYFLTKNYTRNGVCVGVLEILDASESAGALRGGGVEIFGNQDDDEAIGVNRGGCRSEVCQDQ